jgi:hypothetical protein
MIDLQLHHKFYAWLSGVTLTKNLARNVWLEGSYCEVYIRYFRGQIQIANVQVHPEHWHKGIFTNFLSVVERCGHPIKIENVHNERLAKYLDKRKGYTCEQDNAGTPSFYKD